MAERDLGEAVIVYDAPDGETVERTVENEHVAYFQDHWIVKLDEDEAGNDVVRRIPLQRVHYVERSVEEFEDEVETVRHRVESFVENVQSTLLGGSGDEGRSEPHRIDIESGRDDERR